MAIFYGRSKISPKCKICNIVLISGYEEYNLRSHLNGLHPLVLKQLIVIVQTLTASLYYHFEVDLISYKARCIICYQKLYVFRIHDIELHLTRHSVNMETIHIIRIKIFESINNSRAEVNNVDSVLIQIYKQKSRKMIMIIFKIIF